MVSFVCGTYSQYKDLLVKDPDALYFIEDLQRIYKGDILMSSTSVKFVGSLPAMSDAVEGLMYAVKDSATGKYNIYTWNGTEFVLVVGASTQEVIEIVNDYFPGPKIPGQILTTNGDGTCRWTDLLDMLPIYNGEVEDVVE